VQSSNAQQQVGPWRGQRFGSLLGKAKNSMSQQGTPYVDTHTHTYTHMYSLQ
jgi:hypothetical protein